RRWRHPRDAWGLASPSAAAPSARVLGWRVPLLAARCTPREARRQSRRNAPVSCRGGGFPGDRLPWVALRLLALLTLAAVWLSAPGAATAQSGPPAGQTAASPPTVRLWATREGLVGRITASGHVIVPNDH